MDFRRFKNLLNYRVNTPLSMNRQFNRLKEPTDIMHIIIYCHVVGIKCLLGSI